MKNLFRSNPTPVMNVVKNSSSVQIFIITEDSIKKIQHQLVMYATKHSVGL